MQFLHPAFLFALAAASIPILLHFLHRRRLDRIPFAPMRFLLPTQERQSQRLNFRRLLLLLLRIGAIVCIVLALARPTLTGGLNWLAPEGTGVSVLLLVDDSASMRAQGSEGILFEKAKKEAAGIARGLSGKDELCIATFSDVMHPLLEDFVSDPSLVLAALNDRQCGWRRTDYIPVLQSAFDLLDRASKPHREIHLIGDLQRTGIDSVAAAVLSKRLTDEENVHVFLRRVEVEPFVNRQVERVSRPPSLLRPGETTNLVVDVRQDGDRSLAAQLFLEVDTLKVGETELELPPFGRLRHSFPVTLPTERDLSGVARLRPDRFPVDDQRYFVVEMSGRVQVLVLRGLPQSEPRRDPLLFLEAALDPRGGGRGDFALTVEEAVRMDVGVLQKSRVVVSADPYELGAARLAALSTYLRGGGTLLLFLGDPRERAYANEKLLPQWTTARLGPFRGGRESFEHLELVASGHPAFAGFSREEIETLQEVKLRDFYHLPEEASTTLLRFGGGGAAVSEIEVGEGRLILCGFHPSATSGNLPYSPMFLPLVQRLTGYLATAAWSRFGRGVEVGQLLTVAAPGRVSAASLLQLRGPGGKLWPVELDAQSLPPRLRGARASEPGLFTFLVDGQEWARVAANVPRSESLRKFNDPKEFKEAVFGRQAKAVRALQGEEVEKALVTARRGRPLHRWFLLLAGLFLIAESLLGRRISALGEK